MLQVEKCYFHFQHKLGVLVVIHHEPLSENKHNYSVKCAIQLRITGNKKCLIVTGIHKSLQPVWGSVDSLISGFGIGSICCAYFVWCAQEIQLLPCINLIKVLIRSPSGSCKITCNCDVHIRWVDHHNYFRQGGSIGLFCSCLFVSKRNYWHDVHKMWWKGVPCPRKTLSEISEYQTVTAALAILFFPSALTKP